MLRHKGSTANHGLALIWITVINPVTRISPSRPISILNWELTLADGARTTKKIVRTNDLGLINQCMGISWGFSAKPWWGRSRHMSQLPLIWSLATFCYIWVEWYWVVFTQLRGLWSCAHKAGNWIWTSRSDATLSDPWVGIFFWWTICHRMDYGTVMKRQWKTDIMEVSNNDL